MTLASLEPKLARLKPRFEARKAGLLPMKNQLVRLLRFGYGFAFLFLAILAFGVIWSAPLLAISLSVTGYLISDTFAKAGKGFNIRPIILVAAGIGLISFVIFYAVLGLALDLQSSDVAVAQGNAYLELAKTFGLMAASCALILSTLGLVAIIKAHIAIRRERN